MKCFAYLLAFAILSISLERTHADEASVYQSKIKPILQSRCYACHGVLMRKSGLRLDTAAAAIAGGESGPSIVVGSAATSSLYERIVTDDLSIRMPPEGEPLKADEIELVRKWIDEGAVSPNDEVPEPDPEQHWAFQLPVKKDLPSEVDAAWASNPIDRWVSKQHGALGLVPQSDAPKGIWLRRVYLDLIGIPPTIDELAAFEGDHSADPIDKVVTRLLDSPQYGERWGRHWMDIWRYSDAWGLGAEIRNSQKHLWRWRDWIIESLGTDKPYDQMLREMLAADELYPEDASRLRATGYLARNYFKFNRTTWMDETIEHTSKAMLGLTLNCGKCHDHKYDPFTQQEYYQLRAFIEPYQVRMDMVEGELDLEKNGLTRVFDCNPEVPTYFHNRGDDRNPDRSKSIPAVFPKFLVSATPEIKPIELPVTTYMPSTKPEVAAAHRARVAKAIEAAQAQLLAAQMKPEETDALQIAEQGLVVAKSDADSLEARLAADAAVASTAVPIPEGHPAHQVVATAAKAQRQAEAHKAQLTLLTAQQNHKTAAADKQAELQKAVDQAVAALDAAKKELESTATSYRSPAGSLKTLESNLEDEASRTKPFPRVSTGRRKALAEWIANDRNPLTARVAVNHIWARHFGQPLVATVFDFGRKGKQPTDPDLLDWLAVDLMEHNWSMKHLHRLIVTSKTYRLGASSVSAPEKNRMVDPENRRYWRGPIKRMESQIVRDAMLSLAGQLDSTVGGPSVPANDEASKRRSLYFFQSHNEHNEFLSVFDDANVMDCYRRTESIVPQQSLALVNSKLVNEVAGTIANRIGAGISDGDDAAYVAKAFVWILSSPPDANEAEAVKQTMAKLRDSALKRNSADAPAAEQFARKEIVRVLLNHNDFITIR